MDANKPARESHGHCVAAEPDRISTRIVVGFGVVLIIMCVVAAVLVAALFRTLDRGAEKKDEKVVAAAGLERRESGPPPLPRLQIYPVQHWKDFQSAERERLTTYGWMDRETGAVHIPIDRAIERPKERGHQDRRDDAHAEHDDAEAHHDARGNAVRLGGDAVAVALSGGPIRVHARAPPQSRDR